MDDHNDIFDNIMEFSLSVITSTDYLASLNGGEGIFVGDILYGNFLREFADQFNNGTLQPGLYPVVPGTDTDNFLFETDEEKDDFLNEIGRAVHWFAVRRDGNRLLAFNGYSSNSPQEIELDGSRSFGLNAQEEGSHGFCQTIALMSYLKQENLLSDNDDDEKRYKENLWIITNWLKDFTKQNDFVWTFDVIRENQLLKENTINFLSNRYKKIRDSETISLSQLFYFITLTREKSALEKWFDEEGDELSDDDDLLEYDD